MRWVLTLALVAAACRKPADGPDADELAALADRSLAVYDRITAAVEQAPDCDHAAVAVGPIVAAERGLLEEAARLSDDPKLQAAAQAPLQARAERTAILTRRMDVAFARCAESPAFETAIADLP